MGMGSYAGSPAEREDRAQFRRNMERIEHYKSVLLSMGYHVTCTPVQGEEFAHARHLEETWEKVIDTCIKIRSDEGVYRTGGDPELIRQECHRELPEPGWGISIQALERDGAA